MKTSSYSLGLVHVVLLGLFVGISYYPGLDVPFIFDDLPNIVFNPTVQPESFGDLLEAVRSPVSSRRPLPLFSFAVNYLIGDLDVFGYHIFNIAVHIGNSLLLYLIFLLLPAGKNAAWQEADPRLRRNLAFLAAVLWAVNPVQTQAVTYIVQRMTSMATFFYLAAILSYLAMRTRIIKDRPAVLLIIVFFLLGLGCKEIVATLPLALFLLELCFFYKKQRVPLYFLLTFSALLIIGGLGWFYLQGHIPDFQVRYVNRNFSPWERVMTQWRVLWHYLSIYLLPLPSRLHLSYDPAISESLVQPWTTGAGLAAMFATLIGAYSLRHRRPAFTFAVFFYFLAHSVEASFVNLELAFIHRLYLPSTFLLFGLLRLPPPKVIRKTLIVFLVFIALWSYWTVERNAQWQNAEKFWKSDLELGGTPARSLNNRAAALIDAGRLQEAIKLLYEGMEHIKTFEDERLLHYNLGFAYFYNREYDKALESFQHISQRYGAYRDVYVFIGKIYMKQGKTKPVWDLINELEKAPPEKAYQGKLLLAELAIEDKQYKKAELIVTSQIELVSPSEVETYSRFQFLLARIHLLQENPTEAYKIFLKLTELFPQNYSAWKMLYLMLKAGGDDEKAGIIRDFLESKGVEMEKVPDTQ